jgi:hypothetical protein
MLLSFAYLAYSALLRLLVGVTPRYDRQIAPSSLRSSECYRGGGRGWWTLQTLLRCGTASWFDGRRGASVLVAPAARSGGER